MSDFSKRPSFSGKISDVDLSINDVKQAKLKGYQELAHHCYGRTVTGEETDEHDRKVTSSSLKLRQIKKRR